MGLPLVHRRSKRAGLPPGSLVHLGQRRVEKAAISVTDFDPEQFHERTLEKPEECREYVGQPTSTWFNITGLHDPTLLQQVGDVFDIHPLVLEDICNTGHRPKLEEHGHCLFVLLKMLYRSGDGEGITAEQVSLILGKGYLVSFQEVEGDVFGVIRERIRTHSGRIRDQGCDYLAYALIDAIVDNYFVVLEDIGDRMEQIQEQVIEDSSREMLREIHQLKRDMIFVRKSVWPLREVVGALERIENPIVGRDLAPYLRDVYEHTIQVVDMMDSLRDMLTSALEIYMSSVSNRMNEVMKVLTIIATIFMPLTFIAGIYGMNFRHMPELECPYAYPAVLALMAAVAVGMAVYFRRRKWL